MALRGEDIQCVGGECYAYIFENPNMGLKRGLFWNFFLECAPVILDGEEWEASILCDWVQFPMRNWREAKAVGLDTLPNREMLEASFYLLAHNPVDLSRLEIAHDRGHYFRVRMAGSFAVNGFEELEGIAVPLDVTGSVQFKGLIVMPDNLFPKPTDAVSASNVASEFIELEDFGEPTWDGSRFLFEPRVDGASL